VHDAIQAFRYVDIVAYIGLGVVTFFFWLGRRDEASKWAAIAFGDISLLELLALVPEHSGNLPERALGRVVIALLVVFPYFLFRFTNAFRKTSRELGYLLLSLSAILVIWDFALPKIPQAGEPRPAVFQAYAIVFFIHWAVLSSVSASSLWRSGSAQPTVARRRMQLLAIASATLTLAILLAVATTSKTSGFALATGIAATVAVAAFFLGFAPPRLLRMFWRTPEQARMQEAVASLLTFAESQAQVVARVLEPSAAIVGARAIAIRNAERQVVGRWNVAADVWDTDDLPVLWPDARIVRVPIAGGGEIAVWTSPFAPVFGDEELSILRSLGGLMGLALDRVRLFQAEHEARLALERADELKLNFIALAAHELRTPVTTIRGFVTTLNHLGDRLADEQRLELQRSLVMQTERLSALVEQLLDLSRLDAEAIDIAPEPIAVRAHLEQIVNAAAPDSAAVHIDVPADTVAIVDRDVLERIVTNLVTNAFRYGSPPVTVSAEQHDRHFRLTVEDGGRGVAPEFVPDLFERFARSEGSRAGGVGTGLGLAIARSYARAHGGDLVYEDAEPHGARFRLVLPIGQ